MLRAIASSPPTRHPVDVLIVDGDPDAAHHLETALLHNNLTVQVATDGEGAVRACRRDRPTTAVVDPLHLPQGGIQVLARLRAADPHLPILTYCELRPAVTRTLHRSGAGRVIAKGDLPALLAALAETPR